MNERLDNLRRLKQQQTIWSSVEETKQNSALKPESVYTIAIEIIKQIKETVIYPLNSFFLMKKVFALQRRTDKTKIRREWNSCMIPKNTSLCLQFIGVERGIF